MQRDREYMLDILEAAKLAIQYIDEKNQRGVFQQYTISTSGLCGKL